MRGEVKMKDTLQPGIGHELTFTITETKTVPALYPESSEFQAMPDVFATGYMVGLIEWTCIQAVNPFLDWPEEQTVGTHIDVSHIAATPPGLEVTAKVRLVEVDGRRLAFEVEAHDGVDLITRGIHERYIINRDKFVRKMKSKARVT
jgi:fluoroacetyl-CoA thioesterase